MSDSRQEFVEAIHFLLGALVPPNHESQIKQPCGQHCCCRYLRRACIAFADALHPDITSSGPIMAALSGEKLRKKERAALLRECGLEEPDGEDGEGD